MVASTVQARRSGLPAPLRRSRRDRQPRGQAEVGAAVAAATTLTSATWAGCPPSQSWTGTGAHRGPREPRPRAQSHPARRPQAEPFRWRRRCPSAATPALHCPPDMLAAPRASRPGCSRRRASAGRAIDRQRRIPGAVVPHTCRNRAHSQLVRAPWRPSRCTGCCQCLTRPLELALVKARYRRRLGAPRCRRRRTARRCPGNPWHR